MCQTVADLIVEIKTNDNEKEESLGFGGIKREGGFVGKRPDLDTAIDANRTCGHPV